jgi:hypothetical protein
MSEFLTPATWVYQSEALKSVPPLTECAEIRSIMRFLSLHRGGKTPIASTRINKENLG